VGNGEGKQRGGRRWQEEQEEEEEEDGGKGWLAEGKY